MNWKFWEKKQQDEYNVNPDRDLIVLGDDPREDLGEDVQSLMMQVTSQFPGTIMRWDDKENQWRFTVFIEDGGMPQIQFTGETQVECLLKAKAELL